jgi:hypothetical protein
VKAEEAAPTVVEETVEEAPEVEVEVAPVAPVVVEESVSAPEATPAPEAPVVEAPVVEEVKAEEPAPVVSAPVTTEVPKVNSASNKTDLLAAAAALGLTSVSATNTRAEIWAAIQAATATV